jgi:hypothetical protein
MENLTANTTAEQRVSSFATLNGSFWGNGAGCPIADPGGCEHDGREEDLGQ